jgi:hypothetical protein
MMPADGAVLFRAGLGGGHDDAATAMSLAKEAVALNAKLGDPQAVARG